jgi:hypothetical protein
MELGWLDDRNIQMIVQSQEAGGDRETSGATANDNNLVGRRGGCSDHELLS